MKKYHRLIVSLFGASSLLLFGCGDGDNPPPSNASPAGVPLSVAGSEITINPVIKFGADGSTFDYNNNLATDSDFPPGAASGTFTSSFDSSSEKVFLTLTADPVWLDGDLSLELTGFLDVDGSGLIDTFSYTASYGAVTAGGSGEFSGGKPANPNADASSIPDVSGAPTEDEWNKYIVGKNAFFLSDDGSEADFVDIQDSGSFAATDEDGTEYGTYTYEKVSEITGNLTVKEGGGQHRLLITFDDFFSGEYRDLDEEFSEGDFRIFTDVSFFGN